MKKLESEMGVPATVEAKRESSTRAKLPKLPLFQDRKDELDSYIQRLKCFAKINGWDVEQWTSALSTLLTGKALEVYSKLSDAAAVKYDQLKEALLRRYDLAEDGYRLKFAEAN